LIFLARTSSRRLLTPQLCHVRRDQILLRVRSRVPAFIFAVGVFGRGLNRIPFTLV